MPRIWRIEQTFKTKDVYYVEAESYGEVVYMWENNKITSKDDLYERWGPTPEKGLLIEEADAYPEKLSKGSWFYGECDYKERSAQLLKDGSEYVIKFYDHGSLVRERVIASHSERYAEDTAENWVIGVIN